MKSPGKLAIVVYATFLLSLLVPMHLSDVSLACDLACDSIESEDSHDDDDSPNAGDLLDFAFYSYTATGMSLRAREGQVSPPRQIPVISGLSPPRA